MTDLSGKELPRGIIDGAKKYDDGKPPVVQGNLWYFPLAHRAVATVSYYGAAKYEVEYADNNFAGLDPNRLVDAEGRHLLDQATELYDPESSLLHAAHKAWEALAHLNGMLSRGIPLRNPEVTESLSDLAAKARRTK